MQTSAPRSPFFPIARAGIDRPAIGGDGPLEERFRIAGFDRAAGDEEITVFRAPAAGRVLSCDEHDFSGSKILVADGMGRIVEFGENFTHDPSRQWKSFQRRIDIPAGGMAVSFPETAHRALAFYDLVHENAYFPYSTTGAFTDLTAALAGDHLTFSYRPTPLHPGPVVDFLFVGNSATFVYNTPTIFRNMARHAGRNVNADYCMFGGARLAQYADGENERGRRFREMLAKKKYDFIVFHDAGREPAEQTHRALETLIPMARETGAAPLLYMRYSDCVARGDFYERVIDHFTCYSEAGRRYGIPVAPSAVAYYNCTAEHPEIGLYAEDLDHHSKAGAYLNACLFLRTFLGIDPKGNGFRSGVDPSVEKILQEVAARTCRETGDCFTGERIVLRLPD